MNKNLLLVFSCILFFPVIAFCQCDSDSIVVQYIYENNVYQNINEHKIITTAFDRDSSISTSSTQECPFGWNWQPAGNPIIGNYNKYDTIFNNGLPAEVILLQGSGVGWFPSSKTVYTYNLNLFKTGDYSLQWNGSAWDTLHYRIWIYDSSDEIISTSYYAGGNYLDKTDIFYSGGQVDSEVIYKGNINTWINKQKFIFYYTGSLRTSADFYEADTLGNWLFLGQHPYTQNTTGQWVIHVNQIKPTPVQFIDDTLEYEFDTLQNKVYEMSYLFSDTISCYYSMVNKVYIDSALYTTYSYSEDLDKSANYWISFNTPYRDYYTYDSYNRVIIHSSTGGCSNVCGTDYTYSYDNYGRVIRSTLHNYTVTIDNYFNTDYYYVNPGEMKVIVPPLEDSLTICPDSSYQPNVIIVGGCGPYHYQWQPSTGLSSDTVLQPVITVNDTASYTIYAHDDYGGSDSAGLIIQTYYHNNHITISNQLCDGSGQLTFPNVPATTVYQWYSGSHSVGGSSNHYIATPPGDFWCYANFQLYSPHTFYCKLQSDTFALLSPPTPVLSQSADTIFSSMQGTNYQWFHDSTLVANTTDSFLVVTHSGNYHVIVTDSVGCNRTSNILIVFPGVEEIDNKKFYVVENTGMNSVTIFNELVNDSYVLTVSDANGKRVLSMELEGRKNIVSMETIPAGIYLLNFELGDRIYSKKIIKN